MSTIETQNAEQLALQLETIAALLRDGISVVTHPSIAVSIDGRSANWFAHQFEFTAFQAAAVLLLWQAFQNGTPVIGGSTIVERIGCSRKSTMTGIFDKGNHPAWGTMIVSGTRNNTYQISATQSKSHDDPKRGRQDAASEFVTRLRSKA